jgi:6-phosphogluconolactonase
MMPADREIVVLDDTNALADEAARRFADAMRAAVDARGRFVVALSGGSTPRALHARLVAMGADALPWARAWVIFGDERCVPPDDPASNYGMARDTLLSHVPVPESHVLRMEGERGPDDAAERYEALLRGMAARLDAGDDDPLLDLMLLGVGTDGHTASLFPGTPALDETERWVVPGTAPVAPHQRLTLTFPALSRARQILVLAAGADKRDPVTRVLGGDDTLPSARPRGRERTVWLLDRAAAPAGSDARTTPAPPSP